MKRSKRLVLSGLVLLVSPLVGLLAAVLIGRMIPGHELFVPLVNFLVPLLVFVIVTGLGALLGLRFIWDRRFD